MRTRYERCRSAAVHGLCTLYSVYHLQRNSRSVGFCIEFIPIRLCVCVATVCSPFTLYLRNPHNLDGRLCRRDATWCGKFVFSVIFLVLLLHIPILWISFHEMSNEFFRRRYDCGCFSSFATRSEPNGYCIDAHVCVCLCELIFIPIDWLDKALDASITDWRWIDLMAEQSMTIFMRNHRFVVSKIVCWHSGKPQFHSVARPVRIISHSQFTGIHILTLSLSFLRFSSTFSQMSEEVCICECFLHNNLRSQIYLTDWLNTHCTHRRVVRVCIGKIEREHLNAIRISETILSRCYAKMKKKTLNWPPWNNVVFALRGQCTNSIDFTYTRTHTHTHRTPYR